MLRRLLRYRLFHLRPLVRRRTLPTMEELPATKEALSDPIRRARDLAESDSARVRTLDDLADAAGLSRYHFARRFRRETGVPPWEFVRRVRTERALRLLEEGRPPAEVAFETGFADQAHLTRTLRQRDGRTPAEVRRDGRSTVGQPDDRAPRCGAPSRAARTSGWCRQRAGG